MRIHLLALGVLSGCLGEVRGELVVPLELALASGTPRWQGAGAALTGVQLVVADVSMREPVDGLWGEDAFDERPSTPFTTGVVGAAWDDLALVERDDATPVGLGLLDAHAGPLRTMSLVVAQPLRVRGEVERTDGVFVPFDIGWDSEVAVRDVPIDLTLDVDEPPQAVRVVLDLAPVLQAVGWQDRPPTLVDASTEGVVEALDLALLRASAWSVEVVP